MTDDRQALVETGLTLSAELSLDALLQRTVEAAASLTGARYAALGVIDPSGNRLERFVYTGLSEEQALRIGHLPEGLGILGAVIADRAPLRLRALEDDPRSVGFPKGHPPMRGFLGVPILLEGRAYGNLYLTEKEGDFSDEDERLVVTLAAQAAVAIANARLYAAALRRIVEAQELERRRLALELHDQTGQELTSALLGLKLVESATGEEARARALAIVREQLVATLAAVRRIAVELRPKALDDFGLVPALERLTHSLTAQTGITIELVANLTERLPADVETALYRVVQEALTNAIKHAQSQTISVIIRRGKDTVVAVVEDDGRGFDPLAPAEGLGLTGMRERLSLVSGRLKIESSVGIGTTLVAEVPV